MAQLKRGKGKCTREVEPGDMEGCEEKGSKIAELTVAMIQYFGTASALYLFSLPCSELTGESDLHL